VSRKIIRANENNLGYDKRNGVDTCFRFAYSRQNRGTTMNDSQIIDKLGGTGKVAAILGIKPPSVSEWRVQGIPQPRRQTLALLFPDVCPAEWRPTVDQETAA